MLTILHTPTDLPLGKLVRSSLWAVVSDKVPSYPSFKMTFLGSAGSNSIAWVVQILCGVGFGIGFLYTEVSVHGVFGRQWLAAPAVAAITVGDFGPNDRLRRPLFE
jgi:hypothetical protein